MYKFATLLLLTLLPILHFAQPINSWPDQDTWWTLQYYDDFGNPTGILTRYHLDQDTLISGQTYQQIWYPNANNSNGSYCCATRQDSAFRVWYMDRDSTSEVLLYDFGAQVGDTIRGVFGGSIFVPKPSDTVIVTRRDTIQMNDGPHLQLEVGTLDNNFWMNWWDGVGNNSDVFRPTYHFVVSGTDYLECNSRQGNSIYGSGLCLTAVDPGTQAGLFSVSPNPVHDAFRVEFPEKPLEATAWLTDLQGKVLREYPTLPEVIEVGGLTPGVYFLTVETAAWMRTVRVFVE